ncbi:hypothetical protein [Streptomyces sp. NPDC002588]|uniref:hypothetical protein n=1 Tax=Streptomyces sp. NPDC002588 TaxID=3154419 RepID=UPI00332414EA
MPSILPAVRTSQWLQNTRIEVNRAIVVSHAATLSVKAINGLGAPTLGGADS